MVYTMRLGLPIDVSNGNYGPIKDNKLIIYYKFDQALFNESSISYPSLGNNVAGNYGPSVSVLGKPLTFEVIEWDMSFNFSSPNPMGFLDQNASYYDGVAC